MEALGMLREQILCSCCSDPPHNDTPGNQVVTCIECGQPCSCAGCVMDAMMEAEGEDTDHLPLYHDADTEDMEE